MAGRVIDAGGGPPSTVARRELRVLLSAYACGPHQDSEAAIGWHWATELARAGHEVWVITRTGNSGAIERALAIRPVVRLYFIYYDLPRSRAGARDEPARLHYLRWQWGAYRVARRLCREVRFDVVHHLTAGGFRRPTFMAFLGVPFVLGPVGGGESAPRALRRTFHVRGYVTDLARDVANWAVRVDPLMTAVYRHSAATLCRTDETRQRIPARYREKCLVRTVLGTDDDLAPRRNARPNDGAFRVLYAGRLACWKGVHLGLMAFAKLRETHPEARLTIIGSGSDESWLRDQAERLGIGAAVTWIPWMERAGVLQAYARHDAFLFPGLHGSSGSAVLEALSAGLPVVCLDVGGAALLVDASCGFRVPPATPERAVRGLADALAALAADPALAAAMGRAAVRRAREHFSWPRQVSLMEDVYLAACGPAHPAARSEQREA